MSYIREEVEHDEFSVLLTVLEKTKDETYEPWKIIDVDVDSFESYTPQELQQLGLWLIEQGKRIKGKYTKDGKLK